MKTICFILTFILISIAGQVTGVVAEDEKPSDKISFYNRKTQRVEVEKVFGNAPIRFAYETKLGLFLTNHLLSYKWVSRVYGSFKNTKISAKKIPAFVLKYNINMADFEGSPFRSFNQFFIRKFKEGKRNFSENEKLFSAGAEARYLAVENITLDTTFPVKGTRIYLPELLGSQEAAEEFIGGTIVIARLCPVDYHRFHFPVSGSLLSATTIHGDYFSVNPIALKVKPDILFMNERQISLIENPEFGKLAMVEVGAFAVGKIVQSAYTSETQLPLAIQKGQEKGYFLFGGSTVIWVFKKGAIRLDTDLVQNSQVGLETLLQLGDQLGTVNQD